MAPQNPPPSPLQAEIKSLWIRGFLAWLAVVVLFGFAIWYFIWGWPAAVPEGPEDTKTLTQAPVTPAPPPAPSTTPGVAVMPPADLKTELSFVLARLGEANQKKDLHQLLSLYAPTFPDLPQKTQEISRSWSSYDFLGLSFRLTELKSPTPDSASARVTWEIKTRRCQTGEIRELTKVYLVGFTKEAGQWRINSLEKVKPGEQENSG